MTNTNINRGDLNGALPRVSDFTARTWVREGRTITYNWLLDGSSNQSLELITQHLPGKYTSFLRIATKLGAGTAYDVLPNRRHLVANAGRFNAATLTRLAGEFADELEGELTDPTPVNTRIEYRYRDAANYKQHGNVIFPDVITDAERAVLAGNGDQFLPGQVGVETLEFEGTYDDDGPWHELGDISLTDDEPTTEETIHAFVARFEGITWRPWDYGDPNPVGEDDYSTITVVVTGAAPPAGHGLAEVMLYLASGDMMFGRIEPGVTRAALDLGADYSAWVTA